MLRNRNPHKNQRVARFVNIEASARPAWVALNAAATLDFLVSPPGNRLEVLKRARNGQHSIRINEQFRVCFVWISQGPTNVEI
jgi:proteic killer suppression protein